MGGKIYPVSYLREGVKIALGRRGGVKIFADFVKTTPST